MLDTTELGKLFAACYHDPLPARGARDAALLAILAGAGLRRSEAAGLDVADFNPAEGALTIVAGKGNKSRVVPLPGGATAAIKEWLGIRGSAPGPLICAITKGDNPSHRGLTPQAVYGILQRLAGTANVPHFSPHDLRRTYISSLLAAGADLALAQRAAGHSSPTTTARYDRRGKAALEAAVSRLSLPFTGGSHVQANSKRRIRP